MGEGRASGDHRRRRERGPGRARCRTPAASIWCRPSPASARPIGTRMRGAPFSASPATARSAHIVRAALESVCYQTADLLTAMRQDIEAADAGVLPDTLRVDGGMVANDWVCQYLADILDCPVERPAVIETTALGAAYLAGLAVGIHPSMQAIADSWRADGRFAPKLDPATRKARLDGWADAVSSRANDPLLRCGAGRPAGRDRQPLSSARASSPSRPWRSSSTSRRRPSAATSTSSPTRASCSATTVVQRCRRACRTSPIRAARCCISRPSSGSPGRSPPTSRTTPRSASISARPTRRSPRR